MNITNVVSVTHIHTRINLHTFVKQNTNCIYRPNKFTAAVWNHKKISGSAIIYPNGKLIHVGKPSILPPRVHIRRFVRLLQKQGYICTLDPIKTVSKSAVYTLGGCVNLKTIASHFKASFYEPEIINAVFLKYRSVSLSVFYTGRVILTGLKNSVDVYPILLELELFTI